MKFTFNASPNLRDTLSTKRIMLDLMIGLCVVFGFSLFYYYQAYGMEYVLQAIKLLAVALITAYAVETLWALATKQDVKKFLGSSFPFITATILTMMCTINTSPYALCVATVFAILIAKLVFGGFGQNIFNPAAFGRAIIFAAFATASTDVLTTVTPVTMMATQYKWLVNDPAIVQELLDKVGGISNLFIGMYPGAIGETSALVILLVGAWLCYRKVIDWRVPTVYLASVFVLTSVVAITAGLDNWLWYPLFHVLSGGVMFGAIFMLTDPVTSPTSAAGRTIFALGCAILTVLIRIKANYPEGVLFSILIMNMLTPMIENLMDGQQMKMKKKAYTVFTVLVVIGVLTTALAASSMTVYTREEPTAQIEVTVDKEAL